VKPSARHSLITRHVRQCRTARLWVWIRAPLCLALAAVLNIAVDSAGVTNEQQGPNSVLALAPPAHSTTIQPGRGEQRAENARQRTPAIFLFIDASRNNPHRHRGSFAAVAGYPRTDLFDTADTQSGRSPPGNLLINNSY
jgi:hypothetical protein